MSRQGAAAALPVFLAGLAGCGADLSPLQPVHGPAEVGITDSHPHEVRIEAPPDAPVLVTVSARDVDVKVAIAAGDTPLQVCDAPNRRMGIETLLAETPHAPVITIRIERNDHSGAGGRVTIEALALPVVTGADRLRLKAAQDEARGCVAYRDIARGDDAAAAYEAAATSWGELGDNRRQGLALLHAAGVRYQRQADWKASSELAARASEGLEEAGAPVHAAFALRLLGAALDQLANASNFELKLRDETAQRARQRLTQAAARFDELGMPFEAGYALSYRGVSFGTSGDMERGRQDFLAALDRFRAAGDEPAQAVALQSLAYQSFEDGRSKDSSREFEQALALIPREEDPANYAHTLHNSALPLRFLGRFDEAIARHHEAAQILRRLGDRDGEARALHSLGTVMAYVGDRERAAELLRTAIRLRGESGARNEQATALVNLAEIERADGRARAAIELDREALKLLTAPQYRARALLSLARDHLAAGEPGDARKQLDELLRLDLPRSNRFVAQALAELAGLESARGNGAEAERLFARALELHEANGAELDRARTLRLRAEARLGRGDADGALADATEALAVFDDIGVQGLQAEARAAFRADYRDAVELRIALLVRAAQARRAAGDTREAERRLRLALDASDGARAQLLSEGRGTHGARAPERLLRERETLYERLAGKREQRDRLLDAGQGESERALGFAREMELLRAQARLLDGRIAQARSAGTGAAPASPGITVDSIPTGVLVAEYFVGRRESWLFEVRRGGVAVHALGPSRELEEAARHLHVSWHRAAPGEVNRAARGRALAVRLFGPLDGAEQAAGIWIVPDGALHLAPMALLARQFWPGLRAGATVVLPALATLQRAPIGTEAPAGTLAIVADPIYELQDPRVRRQGRNAAADVPAPDAFGDRPALRRLPSTAIEARELAALVHDPVATLVLVGPDANRARVVAAPLGRYRIVHFAAHALADSRDPALAMLALSQYDGDGRPLEGALRVYDIAQLRLNADLVVLSGCDTALGREIAGEGPIGLSHAFLRSGARAVVATLWQVPDTSTAALMRAFYREMLVNGRAAPAALELAQAEIQRQPRWSDPYFWAGFQLVSNARLDAGNHNDVAGREES